MSNLGHGHQGDALMAEILQTRERYLVATRVAPA